MFKFAVSNLLKLCTRHKRQHNVCWESLLEIRLDAEGVRCVDEDASVLW